VETATRISLRGSRSIRSTYWKSKYGDIPVAQAPKLPPKGSPGPKGQRLRACVTEALKALQHRGARDVAAATKDLEEGLMRYDAHEG
jgi:hypothetical protein